MRNSRQLRAYNTVFIISFPFCYDYFFNVGSGGSFAAAHFGYRVKLSHLTFPSCWGNDQQSSSPESFPRQGETVRGAKETEKIHSNYIPFPSLFSFQLLYIFILSFSYSFVLVCSSYTFIRAWSLNFFFLTQSSQHHYHNPALEQPLHDLYLMYTL